VLVCPAPLTFVGRDSPSNVLRPTSMVGRGNTTSMGSGHQAEVYASW